MCTHHWIIDSLDFGVCKLCKEKRDFSMPRDKLSDKAKRIIQGMGGVDYYTQGVNPDAQRITFNDQLNNLIRK